MGIRELSRTNSKFILPLKMLQVPPNTFRVKLNLLGRASVGPSGGGGLPLTSQPQPHPLLTPYFPCALCAGVHRAWHTLPSLLSVLG